MGYLTARAVWGLPRATGWADKGPAPPPPNPAHPPSVLSLKPTADLLCDLGPGTSGTSPPLSPTFLVDRMAWLHGPEAGVRTKALGARPAWSEDVGRCCPRVSLLCCQNGARPSPRSTRYLLSAEHLCKQWNFVGNRLKWEGFM